MLLQWCYHSVGEERKEGADCWLHRACPWRACRRGEPDPPPRVQCGTPLTSACFAAPALLGFPLELLGIFSSGYIAYTYFKEDGDLVEDVSKFTVRPSRTYYETRLSVNAIRGKAEQQHVVRSS
eukprot:1191128-Prorocentrum_minimum.AAC.2